MQKLDVERKRKRKKCINKTQVLNTVCGWFHFISSSGPHISNPVCGIYPYNGLYVFCGVPVFRPLF
jgi:hypothetical protein